MYTYIHTSTQQQHQQHATTTTHTPSNTLIHSWLNRTSPCYFYAKNKSTESSAGTGLALGLLVFNASATARVISRRWNDDDDEISYLVEETGVPGGNHRPTASQPVQVHCKIASDRESRMPEYKFPETNRTKWHAHLLICAIRIDLGRWASIFERCTHVDWR